MAYRKMNKRLIALHACQWLPLLGLVLLTHVPEKVEYLPLILIPLCWLLTPIFLLWNLLQALRTLREFDPGVLRRAMWHKIAMLPCLCINFTLWVGVPMGLLNPWTFLAVPLILPFSILGVSSVWLTMLGSSTYVIAQIVLLGRSKTFTLKECVVAIILELLPVTDVLYTLHLCNRFGKPKPVPGQS